MAVSNIGDGNPSGEGNEEYVFTDDCCQSAAEGLMGYWKQHPHNEIQAIRYEASSGQFILTHRLDGEFPMSPERFFGIVRQKADLLIRSELVQRIGEKISLLLTK